MFMQIKREHGWGDFFWTLCRADQMTITMAANATHSSRGSTLTRQTADQLSETSTPPYYQTGR